MPFHEPRRRIIVRLGPDFCKLCVHFKTLEEMFAVWFPQFHVSIPWCEGLAATPVPCPESIDRGGSICIVSTPGDSTLGPV